MVVTLAFIGVQANAESRVQDTHDAGLLVNYPHITTMITVGLRVTCHTGSRPDLIHPWMV
jgi:hypothetical protein